MLPAEQKHVWLQRYLDVCVCLPGRGAHRTVTRFSLCPPRRCPAQAWHTEQAYKYLFMGTKYTKVFPHHGFSGTPSCIGRSGGSQVNKAAPTLQEPKLEGWRVWEELQGGMVAAGLGR